MRLVTATALTIEGVHQIRSGTPLGIALALLTFCSAALLLGGLWTSVGSVTAIFVGLSAATHPIDVWEQILIISGGSAITMLGPGSWSVDGHLFGWKRIDFGEPKS